MGKRVRARLTAHEAVARRVRSQLVTAGHAAMPVNHQSQVVGPDAVAVVDGVLHLGERFRELGENQQVYRIDTALRGVPRELKA